MPKQDVEEYLEAILDISIEKNVAKTNDIAQVLGVSPSSVTEVIQRLNKNGLILYEPYKGVKLTEKGLKIANKIKRKHRIVEIFLSDYLNIAPDKIHHEACRMEHCISDEVTDAICRIMSGPSKCPCGKDIPKCDPYIYCEVCKRR
ncbi:MAG: manganese transport regulator MntR [Candidatus Methanofastidiosum methylothiophilum]|uniref:Manganese transport regulator MntR n=1 Tax=Candidatus Methanofastidiosum methylothiophilum TaxID=1705564 RepID=A0A150IIT1_9EURY|nr:MAG: manganese transport regulator MntR [Candidatus Methanofastidiosum methylthiophilus]KYC47001.1 MAG: manganese transport regulator MntR [Candidatus Methanofastidiosum methylthiophilus]KYC49382.1 MAG: manganese transport regulator MntR [Candidatus Methanofastidiosum methylthiophilus]